VENAAGETFLSLLPVADVSTLDALDAPPDDLADGMMLRTYVRDYPFLLFDLSALPPNVFINRARLLVANDTTRAYGPESEGLVVSEFDPTLLPDAANELTLTTLERNFYQSGGQNSLIPEETGPLAFNVTGSVQRYVNSAYEGTRGFLILAGESFTGYRQTLQWNPGFFLQRFWFYGSDAPADSLRPQLRITYTRNDDISGEEP
jgi:hypothetical protein